jgi:hypothetical protein
LFSPGDIVYSSTALQKIEKPKLNYEKLISLMEFEKISFKDSNKPQSKNLRKIKDSYIGRHNY